MEIPSQGVGLALSPVLGKVKSLRIQRRCQGTGLSMPECSCPACCRRQIAHHAPWLLVRNGAGGSEPSAAVLDKEPQVTRR